MGSINDHLDVLKKANHTMATNCPWLSGQETRGDYTQYGDKGALCKPGEKVVAGRAAASAYQIVRHLEFYHLSECRDILREELSRKRGLAEETTPLLVKDLFDKCEEIMSCISCSCDSAVSAYHNLENLVDLLAKKP